MIGILFTIIMMFKIIRTEELKCNNKDTFIISFLAVAVLIINLICSVVCKNASYYIYSLCFSWLLLLAYIDKMCGYVYEAMEYCGGIITVLSILEIILRYKEDALVKLTILLLFVLIFYVLAKLNIFGAGDADVLAVVFTVFSEMYVNILLYYISLLLFIIRYFKEIIMNRGRLKGGKPFVPSIYMAYVLFILFYCI